MAYCSSKASSLRVFFGQTSDNSPRWFYSALVISAVLHLCGIGIIAQLQRIESPKSFGGSDIFHNNPLVLYVQIQRTKNSPSAKEWELLGQSVQTATPPVKTEQSAKEGELLRQSVQTITPPVDTEQVLHDEMPPIQIDRPRPLWTLSNTNIDANQQTLWLLQQKSLAAQNLVFAINATLNQIQPLLNESIECQSQHQGKLTCIPALSSEVESLVEQLAGLAKQQSDSLQAGSPILFSLGSGQITLKLQ
jgi:hypothetical protein